MRDVVITGSARTPIGSFLGQLASVSVTELGAIAVAAAVKRAGIPGDAVGDLYMGCVLPAGVGQAPARQAALKAGLPYSVPCTTVSKVCGSGLKAVVLAAQSIAAGECDIAVAGGMESMSNAPHLAPGLRGGVKMGPTTLDDHMVKDGLWDVYNDVHMGSCAELCAREQKITRQEQDVFAAESYRRALAAQQNGAFDAEIVPVPVKTRKGESVVATDEEPGRGNTDKLPALRTAFQKQGGTVTAGNASSLNDGGAALVLMAAEVAQDRGITPLVRIVATAQHAQAPEWFTTAPAGAIERACQRAGWEPKAVDLWEINEAFAVVSLANQRLLSLDPEKVNVHGGAVALGHPIGASGARILVTLIAAMEARRANTGGASLCIGGGEAITVLVQR